VPPGGLPSSQLGVIVFERGNPFSRGFELITGMFWSILGRVAVFLLMLVVYGFITGAIVGVVFSGDGFASVALNQVFSGLIGIPTSMLTAALYIITYAELRNRERPGVTSLALSEAMDA
jgi:hypothetical protein